MKQRLFLISIVFIAIGIALALLSYSYISLNYSGNTSVRVYIPQGSSAEAVADSLRGRLGNKYTDRVLNIMRLRGGEAVGGSYVVDPGTRAWSVASRLIQGRQSPVRITFNNIRTLDQLAESIAKPMAFDAADFMSAADSVLPELGFAGRAEFPAAFLPDTYEFYWTDAPDKVIRKLAAEQQKFWTNERLERANSLHLTPVQVATLASIVEEETARTDERPTIARLYLNRLNSSMKLQADPTVKFAIGDFSLRRITGRMLDTPSPYNTYRVDGLPPGPIRIVERSTLDAVLQAPEHPYLYMCARADFSGRHAFAVDYATHMANARAYQAELNRRGIR